MSVVALLEKVLQIMNIQGLSSVAEIIGGIAVIISLPYLAISLRGETQTTSGLFLTVVSGYLAIAYIVGCQVQ